jgi:hypothetical protein
MKPDIILDLLDLNMKLRPRPSDDWVVITLKLHVSMEVCGTFLMLKAFIE